MKSIFKPVFKNIALTAFALCPLAACSSGDGASSLGLQGSGNNGGAKAAPDKPVATSVDPKIDKSAKPMELPDTVRPQNYKLWFRPDAALKTFTGRADVTLEVREPVESIVVAAHNLTQNPAEVGARGVIEAVIEGHRRGI